MRQTILYFFAIHTKFKYSIRHLKLAYEALTKKNQTATNPCSRIRPQSLILTGSLLNDLLVLLSAKTQNDATVNACSPDKQTPRVYLDYR